jgi:hypothetical protein
VDGGEHLDQLVQALGQQLQAAEHGALVQRQLARARLGGQLGLGGGVELLVGAVDVDRHLWGGG